VSSPVFLLLVLRWGLRWLMRLWEDSVSGKILKRVLREEAKREVGAKL